MPCNSDHMEASQYETQASKMYCVLDDLAGSKFDRSDWQGYHAKAYNKSITQGEMDSLIQQCCNELQARHDDHTLHELSLETQMWWRDHQASDKEKVNEKQEKLMRLKKEKDQINAEIEELEDSNE